ncbi:MAG: thioredoxin family protein [Flavobacteriales bacterium]|nr:thioredoxin family protein [Flavobacteriales bacterium]
MKFNYQYEKSFSYTEYRQMMDDLLAEGKTTGGNQDDYMIEYTKLNQKRMQRIEKTVKILPELEERIKKVKPQTWLILTEAWCGDAAQNLPIIDALSKHNHNIKVELILRDENLEIMDQFLTNGGRSIPKVIAIDSENEILFTWGPRPKEAQQLFLESKASGKSHDEFATELHGWYARDKGISIQKEFYALL